MKLTSKFVHRKKVLCLASFVFALLLTTFGAQGGFRSLDEQLTGNPADAAARSIKWPAFNNGGQRNAVNTAETTITGSNVNRLARLWQQKLPDIVDGTPAELPNVATPAGIKELLFVTTKSGSLLAIDAATGNIIWHQDTHGSHITTSSPAIDTAGQFVYSYGLDGYVHRYAVGNGAEYTTGGWPVATTLLPNVEKGSSSLNYGNGYLYMTMSGYDGDGGHYVGHVVAINIAAGVRTVFNALCANIHQLLDDVPSHVNYCHDARAGVWARGGVVIDPVDHAVFITSGNGKYDANVGGHNYGDTVIKLSPDLMTLYDTYTPSNFATLEALDQDLGSAAPVMIPRQRSVTPYLALQAGKDRTLRLLNRANLSGQKGPNHVGGELQAVPLPQGCDVDTQPTAWNDARGQTWVFVANNCGLSVFRIAIDGSGRASLQLAYNNGFSGSSPFIANNILFLQGSGVIRALDPTTGRVLWSTTTGSLHWQSPLVVNGRLYVVDNAGNMTAYSLH